MQPRAVHQFLPACSPGDGIGKGAFYTRRLLRERGLHSEIFAVSIHPELADEVRPFEAYPGAADQVLLIHHGNGNPVEEQLRRLPDQKVLVYHNITPARFFPADDPIQRDLALGRAQLERWRGWLAGAIGDSEHNAEELLAAGYDPATTAAIPLLVDLQGLRAREPDLATVRRHEGRRSVLFAGRRVPHKNQAALLQAFQRLQGLTDQPTELILPGGGTPDYIAELEAAAARMGLGDRVHMPGQVTDAELAGYFAAADAYVSLSEHEGFGMPLIEAMVYDLPVLAYAAEDSSVAETVGEGGLVLADADPDLVAGTLATLFEEPGLRSRLIGSQRRRLAEFEPERIQRRLDTFFQRLGLTLPPGPAETQSGPQRLRYRIEGPFDSSYSLALLNRETARHLDEQNPGQVGLFATEGPGDMDPDPDFLRQAPAIERLWHKGRAWTGADFVTRLLFPPRVTGMNGRFRVLNSYGWEESGFPPAYREQFNAHLDLVTTMSEHVSGVLRDNGVRTPMATVGVGTDHILRAPPDDTDLPELGTGLRFLHISSAFPRKGVDSLLQAYARTFSSADEVVLVLKTFPNPHNTIEDQLRALAAEYPDHGRIILINRDLADGAVRALYTACHALVAPSRGEGFGLPIAEAMLHQRPVITTAHGGQRDFARPDTAWLVDYSFQRAQTHLGLWDSLWAEPDTDDLARHLATFYAHYRDGDLASWAAERVARAEGLVRERYSWSAVVQRLERACARLPESPALSPRPRVGWVTTWNAHCGLATYSQQLLAGTELRPWILANRDTERIAADGPEVIRCWTSGGVDDLGDLLTAIRQRALDQVVIQFNFSLFGLEPLRRLIERLHDAGVQVFLFAHATADVEIGDQHKSLRQLKPELDAVRRIFVHGPADLNRLKAVDVVGNTALFPHGVADAAVPGPADDHPARELAGRTVIATHGFLLPHKGLRQLIEAVARLAEARPDLHLLMLNAEYPADPASAEERERCQATIRQHGLAERVSLVTDFLTESELLTWLGQASVVVYPYQGTQESASGAVRWGLSARKPVLCTPLPIFEDVADVVGFLPGEDPVAIAEGIADLLDDPQARRLQEQHQRDWLRAHDWRRLRRQLEGCLIGLHRDYLDAYTGRGG